MTRKKEREMCPNWRFWEIIGCEFYTNYLKLGHIHFTFTLVTLFISFSLHSVTVFHFLSFPFKCQKLDRALNCISGYCFWYIYINFVYTSCKYFIWIHFIWPMCFDAHRETRTHTDPDRSLTEPYSKYYLDRLK